MRHHRPILLVLLPALLLALAVARVAAQTRDSLVISLEPPVATVGAELVVVAKNFTWDSVARLNITAMNTDEPEGAVPVAENLALGPRRRATLSATPTSPGLWEVSTHNDVAATAWFAAAPSLVRQVLVPAESAEQPAALVATAGSTTGQLTFDTPVEAVVVRSADFDEAGLGAWYFDLAEESAVTLQANAAGSAALLRLVVLDAGGEWVAEEDGVVANVVLPAGRYLLAVISEEDNAAETTYTLSLTTGLSGDSEGGPIAPGTLAPGLLSPVGDLDEYTFTGAPGDVIYAAIRAADGALNPFLELLDPFGNVVAASDAGNGGDALLSYVVPLAGPFVLRLSGAGGTEGSYTLEFAHDPQMARATPPTLLADGQTQMGEVPRNGAQAWLVVGRAGETLNARVAGQTAGFDANLALLGPDGRQLATDDDSGGDLNPVINIVLPGDGTYVLIVGSYTGAAGSYTITRSD